MKPLPKLVHRFCRRDDGALTVFGIFLIATMIAVGGLGLDYANAIMARTQLQVGLDAVGYAHTPGGQDLGVGLVHPHGVDPDRLL